MLAGLEDGAVARGYGSDEGADGQVDLVVPGADDEYDPEGRWVTFTWPSELNEALRATLRAFLAHQCRLVPTARATFLHRNTIAERLRRLETLLGHAVPDRAPELEAALRLHAYFAAGQRMPPSPHTA